MALRGILHLEIIILFYGLNFLNCEDLCRFKEATDSVLMLDVNEHLPIGTIFKEVGIVGTNQQIILKVITGSPYVEFNTSSRDLIVKAVIDVEDDTTPSKIDIDIECYDLNNQHLGDLRIWIFPQDVNEFTPEFAKSFYEAVVSENLSVGGSVITVSANDKDKATNPLIYVIETSKYSDYFEINMEGSIDLRKQLDYDLFNEVNLTVLARDQQPLPPKTGSTTVYIIVEDIDTKPPSFTAIVYHGIVFENQNLNSIVQVKPPIKAFDQDVGLNIPIRYELLDYFFFGNFRIGNSNGEIYFMSNGSFQNCKSYLVVKAVQVDDATKASFVPLIITDENCTSENQKALQNCTNENRKALKNCTNEDLKLLQEDNNLKVLIYTLIGIISILIIVNVVLVIVIIVRCTCKIPKPIIDSRPSIYSGNDIVNMRTLSSWNSAFCDTNETREQLETRNSANTIYETPLSLSNSEYEVVRESYQEINPGEINNTYIL